MPTKVKFVTAAITFVQVAFWFVAFVVGINSKPDYAISNLLRGLRELVADRIRMKGCGVRRIAGSIRVRILH